jgi:hypothetical protein
MWALCGLEKFAEYGALSIPCQVASRTRRARPPMQIVNGYVCKTSCDAALAQRNINPADPQDDVHNPKSPNYGKPEDPQHPGKPLPAWESKSVTFGGALAKVNGAANASDPSQAPSSTQQAYTPGSVISVSA